MVEHPHAGFTGTTWDAVPAEQLAQELTTGPGIAPMAEAGLAYGALAVGLGEAGAEFRAILSVVGNAWGSDSSEEGLAQLAQLADWFDAISTSAQQLAATAAEQAASYEIAQLTMPHVGEVSAAVRMAEQVLSGTMLGAPLAGLFDTAEHQVDALREHAVQVMRAYEAGSERLAVAWEQDRAPAVSAGAALLAEQIPKPPADASPGQPFDARAVVAPAPQPTSVLDLSTLNLAPTPTVMVGSESLVLAPALQPVAPMAATSPGGSLVTAAPPVAAPPQPVATPNAGSPAAASVQAAQRAAAAEAGDLGERIVVDAGFAIAPTVLGGVMPARARSGEPVAVTGEP
ncbi:PPE domain-containing protein [Nocardia salmonicida]|uniref:PPE domain-containing protein n=1 Tax=Nocardia salmonicida TaxID=53431 RepID=UPI0036B9E46D